MRLGCKKFHGGRRTEGNGASSFMSLAIAPFWSTLTRKRFHWDRGRLARCERLARA